MDLFLNAKVVRLVSHHNKYLVAAEDKESVIQGRDGASRNAQWTVELVPNSGQSVICLKSCYNKYLTASNERFLLGATGRKVVQTFQSSLGWIPIREEGTWIKLKTQYGKFLRANGGLPPWRSSVTHDNSFLTITRDTVWGVFVVENHAEAPQHDVQIESGGGMAMEESRKAALAYYDKASPEVKKLAHDFFDSMDTDQDGQVSIDEFVDFFKQLGNTRMDRNFFAALQDRNGNGNGSLQFKEVIPLFYILITQAHIPQFDAQNESLRAHIPQFDAQNESSRVQAQQLKESLKVQIQQTDAGNKTLKRRAKTLLALLTMGVQIAGVASTFATM